LLAAHEHGKEGTVVEVALCQALPIVQDLAARKTSAFVRRYRPPWTNVKTSKAN